MIEFIDNSALYHALLGQGWVVTDLPANIPQGSFAVSANGWIQSESGEFLIFEDGKYIQREVEGADVRSLAYDRALLEDGNYLDFEDNKNLRLEN
jgi:hypothetical protein